MRICFVLPDLSPSGGIAVVLRHADELRAQGFDVDTLVLSDRQHEPGSYDVAIATWWTTLPTVWRLDANHRAVFVQGPDEWFYPQRDTGHRFAAGLATRMPAHVIAVSSWLAEITETVRPGASCHVVPNGIDKTVFAPTARARHDGPLRILIEGSPSLWFKGVGDAIAAVRAMRRRAEITLVGLDPAGANDLDVDRAVSGLAPAEMAALYAEHDVLLKLSRFEGLSLPPLEGFHTGLPCVVTPYGGHEQYVEHGRNGIVVGFDDRDGTTNWLDLIAADRELLARLSAGALETASRWPDPADSSARFAEALRAIQDASAAGSLASIAESAGLHAELGYAELQHLAGSHEWERSENTRLHAKIEELNTLIDELFKSRDECSAMLEQARQDIQTMQDSRAYRAAVSLRKLKPGS